MGTDIVTYRTRIGLFNLRLLKHKTLNENVSNLGIQLTSFILAIAVISTLLIIGNVEVNPGPVYPQKSNNEDIKNCLMEINSKFSKLEDIPEKFNILMVKLSSIIEDNSNKFAEIKKDLVDLADTNSKITQENKDIRMKLSEIVNWKKQMDERARANNLIFYGIEENHYERRSDTCSVIIDTLVKYMGIQINDIHIAYAHRIGKSNIKPILVKFNSCITKDYILGNVKKLHGTHIRIDHDLAPDIRATRKNLLPFLHKARQSGNRAFVKFDKIKINGKMYDLNYLNKYGIPTGKMMEPSTLSNTMSNKPIPSISRNPQNHSRSPSYFQKIPIENQVSPLITSHRIPNECVLSQSFSKNPCEKSSKQADEVDIAPRHIFDDTAQPTDVSERPLEFKDLSYRSSASTLHSNNNLDTANKISYEVHSEVENNYLKQHHTQDEIADTPRLMRECERPSEAIKLSLRSSFGTSGLEHNLATTNKISYSKISSRRDEYYKPNPHRTYGRIIDIGSPPRNNKYSKINRSHISQCGRELRSRANSRNSYIRDHYQFGISSASTNT